MARSDDRKGEGDELVEVGTAVDPAESAMLREYLASQGIDCVVPSEHHRSLGIYTPLRMLVRRSQAEEAAALVRDFRSAARTDENGAGAGAGGEDDGDDAAGEELAAAGEELADWRESAGLRRKLRGARLLSLVVPGLGLAHFAIGARLRGLILAASWPAAIWLATRVGGVAIALIPLSTAVDVLGAAAAMADERKRRRRELPRARAIERRGGGGGGGDQSR
ncbi:MAG TPA: hypothetical protein VKB80_33130 [Kofleriaceae bacterium]|nr:hypothetical protein [Kofleriaceae bacterium]